MLTRVDLVLPPTPELRITAADRKSGTPAAAGGGGERKLLTENRGNIARPREEAVVKEPGAKSMTKNLFS